MESANKAIFMAAGMLFAVMIMSLVAFVFSRLTALPTEEDVKLLVQQAADFNNEYTAYDKRIMYGVDVISVLNKALSNNEKYVLEKFVAGGGYNTDFIIDIEVELKSVLQESMVVSYIHQLSDGVTQMDYMGTQAGPIRDGVPVRTDGSSYSNSDYHDAKDFFKEPTKGVNNYQGIIYGNPDFWDSLKFKTDTFDTEVEGGVYHLLGEDTDSAPVPGSYTNDQLEADNTLKQLLKYSTQMSQSIKNRTGSTFSPYGWAEATWYPATYDLKTRKFKCEGEETVYSEKTGRIIKMVFKEI